MRKSFGIKPWVLPQPVLIIGTYDDNGNADAMNAAWGGQYQANMIELCLGKHKTTDNIKLQKEFTVSFANVEYVKECDYVGLISGNKVPDKLEKAGFTTSKAPSVNAPIIEQLPLTLECKFIGQTEQGNIIGEIINILADEAILNSDGNIDSSKLNLITFNPIDNTYVEVKGIVGQAFSDGKAFL